eukprot:Platyproteum_vivax@DN7204_c0_g1_i1.p2
MSILEKLRYHRAKNKEAEKQKSKTSADLEAKRMHEEAEESKVEASEHKPKPDNEEIKTTQDTEMENGEEAGGIDSTDGADKMEPSEEIGVIGQTIDRASDGAGSERNSERTSSSSSSEESEEEVELTKEEKIAIIRRRQEMRRRRAQFVEEEADDEEDEEDGMAMGLGRRVKNLDAPDKVADDEEALLMDDLLQEDLKDLVATREEEKALRKLDQTAEKQMAQDLHQKHMEEMEETLLQRLLQGARGQTRSGLEGKLGDENMQNHMLRKERKRQRENEGGTMDLLDGGSEEDSDNYDEDISDSELRDLGILKEDDDQWWNEGPSAWQNSKDPIKVSFAALGDQEKEALRDLLNKQGLKAHAWLRRQLGAFKKPNSAKMRRREAKHVATGLEAAVGVIGGGFDDEEERRNGVEKVETTVAGYVETGDGDGETEGGGDEDSRKGKRSAETSCDFNPNTKRLRPDAPKSFAARIAKTRPVDEATIEGGARGTFAFAATDAEKAQTKDKKEQPEDLESAKKLCKEQSWDKSVVKLGDKWKRDLPAGIYSKDKMH